MFHSEINSSRLSVSVVVLLFYNRIERDVFYDLIPTIQYFQNAPASRQFITWLTRWVAWLSISCHAGSRVRPPSDPSASFASPCSARYTISLAAAWALLALSYMIVAACSSWDVYGHKSSSAYYCPQCWGLLYGLHIRKTGYKPPHSPSAD
jgi:hypothetical protein